MGVLKPNFDREGREIRGLGYWLRMLMGLVNGDGAWRGRLVIVVLVVVLAMCVRRWSEGRWSVLGAVA